MAFLIMLMIVFGVPIMITMSRALRWAIAIVALFTYWPLGLLLLLYATIAEAAQSKS